MQHVVNKKSVVYSVNMYSYLRNELLSVINRRLSLHSPGQSAEMVLALLPAPLRVPNPSREPLPSFPSTKAP